MHSENKTNKKKNPARKGFGNRKSILVRPKTAPNQTVIAAAPCPKPQRAGDISFTNSRRVYSRNCREMCACCGDYSRHCKTLPYFGLGIMSLGRNADQEDAKTEATHCRPRRRQKSENLHGASSPRVQRKEKKKRASKVPKGPSFSGISRERWPSDLVVNGCQVRASLPRTEKIKIFLQSTVRVAKFENPLSVPGVQSFRY